VRWLLDAQEDDGSWFGRWGANHVYGTGAVVPALIAAGLARDHRAIRRAASWLERHQNDDGGWGEDLRSYRDASSVGEGASTASQTAWALLALTAGGACDRATSRGVGYLVETPARGRHLGRALVHGHGFPGDFYLNYHLYRLTFPVMALGRLVHGGAAWPR